MATSFNAHYACVYGISNPIWGIGPGRALTIYRPGVSLLIFSGIHGDLYWFMFQELESLIEYKGARKFSDADIFDLYRHDTSHAGCRISRYLQAKAHGSHDGAREWVSRSIVPRKNVHHGRCCAQGTSLSKPLLPWYLFLTASDGA